MVDRLSATLAYRARTRAPLTPGKYVLTDLAAYPRQRPYLNLSVNAQNQHLIVTLNGLDPLLVSCIVHARHKSSTLYADHPTCLHIPAPSHASPDCMQISVFFDRYAVSPQVAKAFDSCVCESGYRLEEQCHHLVCKIDESQHVLLRVWSTP
jgi:hypothetical protein